MIFVTKIVWFIGIAVILNKNSKRIRSMNFWNGFSYRDSSLLDTFNNITIGTGAFIGISLAWMQGTTTIGGSPFTSTINTNIVSNVSGPGSITGINLGSSGQSAAQSDFNISANSIFNLTSNGAGAAVTGINNNAAATFTNINYFTSIS